MSFLKEILDLSKYLSFGGFFCASITGTISPKDVVNPLFLLLSKRKSKILYSYLAPASYSLSLTVFILNTHGKIKGKVRDVNKI